jgi:2'-5' RNA ligase
VPQTGLVIFVPEADARFGEMRRRFDPLAVRGMPAHVTILFPFIPPESVDAEVRRRLARLFKKFSPFRCVFDHVGRFPSTAWLAPMHAAPFIELTLAVAKEFPEYPPYAGVHEAIVPHVTISDGDAAIAAQAEQEISDDLARNGALATQCSVIKLLENSTGRWQAMHEFALVGHQG